MEEGKGVPVVNETKVDSRVQKAMTASSRYLMIAVICTSLLAVFVNAVFVFTGDGTIYHHAAIAFGTFFIVCAVCFLLAEYKTIKRRSRKNDLNRYSFYCDRVNVTVFVDNKEIRTEEIFYSDFVKIKTSEGFLLFYVNNVNAYPVDLKKLSADDKERLFDYIRQKN